MKGVRRFQMPEGANARTMGPRLQELWGEGTQSILLDIDAQLIAVTSDVEADELDEFIFTAEEAVASKEVVELPRSGLTFFMSLCTAMNTLVEEELLPTFLLVGSKAEFFRHLAISEKDHFMGIPIEVVDSYPERKVVIAGSKTPVAPILGIRKSVCIEVF